MGKVAYVFRVLNVPEDDQIDAPIVHHSLEAALIKCDLSWLHLLGSSIRQNASSGRAVTWLSVMMTSTLRGTSSAARAAAAPVLAQASVATWNRDAEVRRRPAPFARLKLSRMTSWS